MLTGVTMGIVENDTDKESKLPDEPAGPGEPVVVDEAEPFGEDQPIELATPMTVLLLRYVSVLLGAFLLLFGIFWAIFIA